VAAEIVTDEIRRRLADAALDYEHADVALAAAHAARVACGRPGPAAAGSPALHDLERCARAIAAAPEERQLAVVTALEVYADELALLGIDDADLVAGDLTPAAVRFQLGRLGAYAAAAPAAAVGLAVNGPAIGGRLGGQASSRSPRRCAPPPAADRPAPPAAHLGAAALAARPDSALREPTLLTLVAGPGCGMVALSLVERVRALRSARAAFERLREHAAIVPTLEASPRRGGPGRAPMRLLARRTDPRAPPTDRPGSGAPVRQDHSVSNRILRYRRYAR
jgi:hypothetical protein